MENNAVDVSEMTVNFGNFTALENIDFHITEGTFNAVVGPNGSGKTTLLKSLLGLVSPNRGSIKIFGRPAESVPASWLGYVPQVKTLDRSFPALPIELVASGFSHTWTGFLGSRQKKDALHILELVGAEELAYRQLSKLSGGELQRIYLARAIARNPRILLLDEPSTGIDMVCETNINHLISEYNSRYKTTVIMVTHNWATASHHAEYVLLLNKAQVSFGPVAGTFSEENLSRTFLHYNTHDHSQELKDYV